MQNSNEKSTFDMVLLLGMLEMNKQLSQTKAESHANIMDKQNAMYECGCRDAYMKVVEFIYENNPELIQMFKKETA